MTLTVTGQHHTQTLRRVCGRQPPARPASCRPGTARPNPKSESSAPTPSIPPRSDAALAIRGRVQSPGERPGQRREWLRSGLGTVSAFRQCRLQGMCHDPGIRSSMIPDDWCATAAANRNEFSHNCLCYAHQGTRLMINPTIERYPELISLAVHEFRTPASVVGGYLRMLQRDTDAPLTERQRKMVDEAEKSAARLVALFSELSDIGKMDAGMITTDSKPLELGALLDDVARHVHKPEDRGV